MKERCLKCHRKENLCVCALIRPVMNRTYISILQDKLETKHAYGTAQIAAMGLENCELVDDAEKLDILPDTYLLYPGEDDEVLYVEDAPTIKRLIVLDGTWKKTNKLLFSNPILQTLPRVSFKSAPPTKYQIRISTKKDSLNTLESIAYFLKMTEGIDTSGIEDPMMKMIENQLEFIKKD